MKIIVMGASAGGLQAIKKICNELPENFKGSVFIVWHMPEKGLGYLPYQINKESKIPATNAEDMEKIRPGHIYVAPPNRHLLIEDSKVRVVYGPKENRFRPAIDPLFRSAAYYYQTEVVGIVLSGMLNDGTSGLWTIKHLGGITMVQDPVEAEYPGMPGSAVDNVEIDYKLKVSEIAPVLVKLSSKSNNVKRLKTKSAETKLEIEMAMDKNISEDSIKKIGEISDHTCPECNGSLWKITEGENIRFRCRTGHAFTVDAYLQELSDAIEDSLWGAVRGLEENASILKKISGKLKPAARNNRDNFLEFAEKSDSLAKKLRTILIKQLSSLNIEDKNKTLPETKVK